jgi:hypothetical protein
MINVHSTEPNGGAKMASKYKVYICSHQVYLTEAQRYDLFACIPVKTHGIMIKAEIVKNLNSRTINEVFCNYEIDCQKKDDIITVKNNTIRIHLPLTEEFYEFDDEFEVDKKDTNKILNLNDILNDDEGGRQSLFFEGICNDIKKRVKSYHKIEIKDIKLFNESVEFIEFNNLKESY